MNVNTSEYYLHICIQLGKKALVNGDPPVGAIVVYQDTIIGQGIENGKSSNDITKHAEIEAVRDAIDNGHQESLKHSTMYTTHEPCIMCSYVIRHHKIAKIVFGATAPEIGGATSLFNILSTTAVNKWGDQPIIQAGVCQDECHLLTDEFIKQLKK